MKDLIIIGAGGLGREVAFLIEHINRIEQSWNVLGFIDRRFTTDEIIDGYPVCDREIFLKTRTNKLACVVAIANPIDKQNESQKLFQYPNLYFPNIVAPCVVKPRDLVLGQGNIVSFHCIFTVDIKIGDFNFINCSCIVGHDVKIGNFNSFMPSVNISGNVRIKDNCFLGVNSCIKEGLTVDDNAYISMGSVVIRNVKKGKKVSGNFAVDHESHLIHDHDYESSR